MFARLVFASFAGIVAVTALTSTAARCTAAPAQTKEVEIARRFLEAVAKGDKQVVDDLATLPFSFTDGLADTRTQLDEHMHRLPTALNGNPNTYAVKDVLVFPDAVEVVFAAPDGDGRERALALWTKDVKGEHRVSAIATWKF